MTACIHLTRLTKKRLRLGYFFCNYSFCMRHHVQAQKECFSFARDVDASPHRVAWGINLKHDEQLDYTLSCAVLFLFLFIDEQTIAWHRFLLSVRPITPGIVERKCALIRKTRFMAHRLWQDRKLPEFYVVSGDTRYSFLSLPTKKVFVE